MSYVSPTVWLDVVQYTWCKGCVEIT